MPSWVELEPVGDGEGDHVIGAVIGAALAVVAFVAYLTAVLRYTIHRAAIGVARALQRNPDQTYCVRVHGWVPTVGAWNPSQPFRRNGQVFGTGTAAYRLDGDGRVQLTWTPKSGEPRDYTGDIPAPLRVGHPTRRRRRILLRAITVVYLVATIGGFSSGFLLSSGPAKDRVGSGLGGVFVAMVLIWIAATAVSVAQGSRSALASRRADGPGPRDR